MRKYLFIVIALCPFVFQACRNSQPSGYRGMPKEYNLCYEEIYGRCYDSIPYAVVALDLYSEGLELDEEHHMRGTGYNLYISTETRSVPTGISSHTTTQKPVSDALSILI